MQYTFPTLVRTKFDKDYILIVDPENIIRYSAGFYIQKGSMKGVVDLPDGTIVEIDFPEKSFILDEGYKLYPSDELIPWDNSYLGLMITKGWKLVAQEQDTITVCLIHNLNKEDDIISILNNQFVAIKADLPNSLWAYSVKQITGEHQVFVPENHFIVVARGRCTINGVEKKQKSWVRSSKNQVLTIMNQDENESIIFLSKTKLA